ncbi:MAG: ATPase, T2SS/T4P/T4SS family [Eubacteriales bacterium]|nr:ATPase, T2SS/T4P/T4SS family [Eubacteriales bacterium]
MPVVSSLSSRVGGFPRTREEAVIGDINSIVSEITFNILRDSPQLVADVSAGNVGKNALETAVIKDMDKNFYHMGLYRQKLIKKVFDYMFGYGELQEYVDDEEISDIDGTKFDEFVVKKSGRREAVNVNFINEKNYDTYCKLIAVRYGGMLNENDSHCRVTDTQRRLRINISIPPRNVSGPAISIRKHRMKSYTLRELAKIGMLQPWMEEKLREFASKGKSIVFCGKGAAGKTTLMRAFINALPRMERVIIAESDAEIYPDKPYCIEQRIKKSNEGGLPFTLADLIREGLTMSLDTYCIGEIVGGEAWEFVKAIYTGHRGIATTHSESAKEVFERILTLSLGADIRESEKTVKEMISNSIDAVIFLKDFKVNEILEVYGYDAANENCITKQLTMQNYRGE